MLAWHIHTYAILICYLGQWRVLQPSCLPCIHNRLLFWSKRARVVTTSSVCTQIPYSRNGHRIKLGKSSSWIWFRTGSTFNLTSSRPTLYSLSLPPASMCPLDWMKFTEKFISKTTSFLTSSTAFPTIVSFWPRPKRRFRATAHEYFWPKLICWN